MTEAELTAQRARFIELLRSHDWSYEYADDYTAFQAGKSSMQRLRALRDSLPDGVQLWNAYAPVGQKLPMPGSGS